MFGDAEMTLKYPWQKLYEEAVLESDNNQLPERLRVAEEAILTRLQELGHVDGRGRFERRALEDAKAGLRVLRRDRRHR